MDGLKPWAKQELQRKGVQDLTHAMIVVESLVELKKSDKHDFSKSKGKGGGDKDQNKDRDKDRDKPSKSGNRKPLFHR